MIFRSILLLISLGLWPVGLALANPTPGAALEKRVVEFRLPNGMQWLFVRQPGAPVFTGVVLVKVGGIEEHTGKSGLAHMFEHMAFKGTREIGTTDFARESALLEQIRKTEILIAKDIPVERARELAAELDRLSTEARQYAISNEIWHLFHRNGAEELNAFTGKDMTGYYARMPSHMVELWAYLTSQMIGAPVLREFYQERNVVMEERRSSTDASPRGKLYEAMLQTAFVRSPYRSMTIGSMDDLQALRLRDAEAFHATFYRPDRMIGAIVGEVDPRVARRAVQQSFGKLSARPPQREDPEAPTPEPEQTEERRVTVRFDAEPSLMVAYHKPSLPHRDDYVFDVLLSVFCDGVTSRLEQRLVQKERLARTIDCQSSTPGARLPNLFLIEGQSIAPHTTAEMLAAIDEEIGRLQTEPVTPAELEKARNNIQADFLWGISTNEGLAQQLAYFQLVAQDWRYAMHHGEVISRITAADIQRVAKQYLVPTNRTIAELVKQ